MKKSIGLLVTVIICSVIGIILTVYISYNWRYLFTSDETAIIGFFGSLLGAILSGFITFAALLITIRHERHQRIEDKITSVLPYLSFKLDDMVTDVIKSNIKRHGKSHVIFARNIYDMPESLKHFCLIVENIGLGSAVDVSLKILIESDSARLEDSSFTEHLSLPVGAFSYIESRISFDNGTESKHYRLEFSYADLLGNKYQQQADICLVLFGHSSGQCLYIVDVNEYKPVLQQKTPILR